MFKSEQELKDFILWARKQQLKHVKVGEIEFTISDFALTADVANAINYDLSDPTLNPRFEPRPKVDANGNIVPTDDPDLFFSVR